MLSLAWKASQLTACPVWWSCCWLSQLSSRSSGELMCPITWALWSCIRWRTNLGLSACYKSHMLRLLDGSSPPKENQSRDSLLQLSWSTPQTWIALLFPESTADCCWPSCALSVLPIKDHWSPIKQVCYAIRGLYPYFDMKLLMW